MRRVVPEHGVKWNNGDLIPKDSLRRCKVCQQPIEHLHAYRTTCGHPRCSRIARSMPPTNKRPRQIHEPPSQEQRAREALARAKGNGVPEFQAIAAVAQKFGMRPIDVMQLAKESSGE